MSTFPSPWAASYTLDAPIDSLCFLYIDVQATGASPRSGALLEVSCRPLISSCNKVDFKEELLIGFNSLVTLPAGRKIPRRVVKLTGIKKATLKSAPLPEVVSARLWRLMDEIKRRIDRGERWVWIAHVARYERSFIRALCLAHPPKKMILKDAERLFDHFPWVCTHVISARLYPTLPRRTLSAMNGVFGGELLEYKRTEPHLQATQLIWHGLCAQLLSREVSTWGELCQWVLIPAKRPKFKPLLSPQKRLETPKLPGVYRFFDDQQRIIYIGMARNLNQRVNQHFRGQKGHDEHHLELISIARDLSFTTRASVLEAKHLESTEIKQYQPKYNRALIDNTAPFYIHLDTGERFSVGTLRLNQDILGPLIDEYVIESIKVAQSCFKGDFTAIHHRGWPTLEVSQWRLQLKRLEALLTVSFDEDWRENRGRSSSALSLLRAWIEWGYRLVLGEISLVEDECIIVKKAAVFAQRLWRLHEESRWQLMLSTGELIWYADTGKKSGSWRSLSMLETEDKDLSSEPKLNSDKRLSAYLSGPPKEEGILQKPLKMSSSSQDKYIRNRIDYDKSRLTFLTICRHIESGEEVFWRPSLKHKGWYRLHPSRHVNSLSMPSHEQTQEIEIGIK